jgi:hypothetical protein
MRKTQLCLQHANLILIDRLTSIRRSPYMRGAGHIAAGMRQGRNGAPMAAIPETWQRDQFQRQVSAAMKLLSTGSLAGAEKCCDAT